MVAFTSILAASAAFAGASAAALGQDLDKRTLTTSGTGTSGGYYYSFWVSGSDVTYANGADGKYAVSWTSGTDNFVAGKGWSLGAERYVYYFILFYFVLFIQYKELPMPPMCQLH